MVTAPAIIKVTTDLLLAPFYSYVPSPLYARLFQPRVKHSRLFLYPSLYIFYTEKVYTFCLSDARYLFPRFYFSFYLPGGHVVVFLFFFSRDS